MTSDTSPSPVCADQLFGRVAHDLNACFRAGKTLPEWIREDLDACMDTVPEATSEQLDSLCQLAERGDRMVVDIVEHLNAGKPIDPPQKLPCKRLITSACSKSLPAGFASHINCTCEFVTANAQALQQTIRIVAGNAVKHHNATRGNVWLTASETHDWFTLAIDDDGPGGPQVDDRRVLSGFIFSNRVGGRWRDATAKHGSPKTFGNRWKRRSDKEVFAGMVLELAGEGCGTDRLMIPAQNKKPRPGPLSTDCLAVT